MNAEGNDLPLDLAAPGCRASITRRTGARRTLSTLRDATGFTASLAILDVAQARALYIYRSHAAGPYQRQVDLGLSGGDEIPLHCTAAGKALLGALAANEVRRTIDRLTLTPYTPRTIGYRLALYRHVRYVAKRPVVVADSEFTQGLTSIAARVSPSIPGLLLAVELSIHAHHGTIGHQRLIDRVQPPLVWAAEQISHRLLPPTPGKPKRKLLTPAETAARNKEIARIRREEHLSYRRIGQRFNLTRQRIEQILKTKEK